MNRVEVGRCTQDAGTEHWILRYGNFANALERSCRACDLETYPDFEGTGLVQTFALIFEMVRETLKDLLYADGLPGHSPGGTLRQSLQLGYLTKG